MESVQRIISDFDQRGYVLSEELATVLYLSGELSKPVLLEGNPGVGKTSAAATLAKSMDTKLVRLQCYEGLDVNNAIYEWNYQKQLLHIKLNEKGEQQARIEKEIFGREYLLERPLLQSISHEEGPVVLLIDEIDRADEEFEAFLLEILSEYQISIPELGTITAKHIPRVILTSNRTRELSDALKRRCLYHWLDYPDQSAEELIINKSIPGIDQALTKKMVSMIRSIRGLRLQKTPGIAESIDWARTLVLLGQHDISKETLKKTLGVILKSQEDFAFVVDEWLEKEG
ncbi:MAG: MoxR family ATPase [Cyclobacteriaceae bacterium]|nr:MoxR family ATPase [Cyclobacteriaceae bacterium]